VEQRSGVLWDAAMLWGTKDVVLLSNFVVVRERKRGIMRRLDLKKGRGSEDGIWKDQL